MLVQFSVKNYLSFCEPVILSLVAVPSIDGGSKLEENTFETGFGFRLVKSAAVYGANASGKSNLLRALAFVHALVTRSFAEIKPEAKLNVPPFRLRTDTVDQLSYVSVIWLDGDERFRYQFSLDKNRIHNEQLFRAAKPAAPNAQIEEKELFSREGLTLRFGDEFSEGQNLPKGGFNRENALFLSYAAQFQGPVAKQVSAWFAERLAPISGLQDAKLTAFTAAKLLEQDWSQDILRIGKHADLGIEAIRSERRQLKREELPDDTPEQLAAELTSKGGLEVFTTRTVFDEKGARHGTVDFRFLKDESEGTRKFISLAGPLLDVLRDGRVLVIDEFDARLHPILTRAIVELFQGPANTKNAQLIFATHDVNLLDRSLLRRDQIWFTEKDAQGATDLYSLVGFEVAPSDSFARNYIQGKYGAVPYVSPLIAPSEIGDDK